MLDKIENDIQDQLATLRAKLKKEPQYEPLFDKATLKLKVVSNFLAESRIKMAEMELLTVGDVVPDLILEDLESLIQEQVGFLEGAKITMKKVKSCL